MKYAGWPFTALLFAIGWASGFFVESMRADHNFYIFMMWFCIAIGAILRGIDKLGERLENAQRLQTTAFRTLRK